MQLRRRDTYRLRKNSIKNHIVAVPDKTTLSYGKSDFSRQAGLTIQEPTLPEKAFAYQICVNKPEDNLAKGKQICGPLTIYAIGCTSATSALYAAMLNTMPTKGESKNSVLLL
ncbi:hypothetical protein P3L10_022602 [Capsicum annuum]|uniref:uncharacterized protein LOC107838878 n=1 Tax=Capsicum annuum TaxID=4072 RepID=UPI001FB0D66E|nr:uncharacterized protein LOC107838878 [Capsicum annuum]